MEQPSVMGQSGFTPTKAMEQSGFTPIKATEQSGFTLIELLAVIAIIGILAALVAGTVIGVGQGGQDARLAGDANSIGKAADRFVTDAFPPEFPVVSLDDTESSLNPENDDRLATDLGVRLIDFDAGLPQDATKTFVPDFLKEVPDSAGLVSWRIVESTGNVFFAEDGAFLARPSNARLDVSPGSSSGFLSSTEPDEFSDYTLEFQMTKGDAAIDDVEVVIPGSYIIGGGGLSPGSVVGQLQIEFLGDNAWDSGETITVTPVDVVVVSTNNWQAVVDYDSNTSTGVSDNVAVKDTSSSNPDEQVHTDVRTHTITITPPVGDSQGKLTLTIDRSNEDGNGDVTYTDADANEASEVFTLELFGTANDVGGGGSVNIIKNPPTKSVYRWLAEQQTAISIEGAFERLAGNQAVVIKTASAVESNTAPVAVADSFTTTANATLTESAPGVLANDSDADGDSLAAVLLSGVSLGSLALNLNGGFVYTSPVTGGGVTVTDIFTYRASDGTDFSNTATVTITVDP